MKKNARMLFTILAALACLSLFGCLDDGGSSTGNLEGDEDTSSNTETNPFPDGSVDLCQGVCNVTTDAAFCSTEYNACYCNKGSWELQNCGIFCAQTGATSNGCGVKDSDQTSGCLCQGGVDPADEDQEAEGNGEETGCDKSGFASVVEITQANEDDDGNHYWIYNGFTEEKFPADMISVENYPSYGAPTSPGTYTIGETETDYKACGFCILIRMGCEVGSSGSLVCEKTFMPKVGGTFTLTTLGTELGEHYAASFENIELQEVTIASDLTTTPVANGETWCLNHYEFDKRLREPGLVEMDPSDDLSCDYPEAPYHFLGPEPGQSDPAAGTVPPMGWPGAYYNDAITGLDLGQLHCDHPEIDTLFIMVGAGWCPSCSDFFRNSVCNDGGLQTQLRALNAEILFVIGDNQYQGQAATNEYANNLMNSYGCDGGYRVSDVDNTAGERVVWGSNMYDTIPWSCAIRMSDMKLTHEQISGYLLDYVGIATENNTGRTKK